MLLCYDSLKRKSISIFVVEKYPNVQQLRDCFGTYINDLSTIIEKV